MPSASIGLLEACDDRQLFALDLYPRQREILEAVDECGRLHVWALGRRSGKTLLGAVVALHACLLRPALLGRLRPGERGYAVGVATNLRQARLFVRAALSIVERSPLLAELVEAVPTEDEIRFVNGTALAAFPCTARGARGWPIFCAGDGRGGALHLGDGGAAGRRPGVRGVGAVDGAVRRSARVIVSSTPWGERRSVRRVVLAGVAGRACGRGRAARARRRR